MALAVDFGDYSSLAMYVSRAEAADLFRATMQAPLAEDQKTAYNHQQHQSRV
jgi:hypothetical protein